MSGPLNKLESVVHAALVARGMSDNEARITITKLKNASVFKQVADIELSSDGRLLALSPVICIGVTPKAILAEWRGIGHWIPLNQIDPTSEVNNKDDTGILIITKWIAEKKGFVDASGKILTPP